MKMPRRPFYPVELPPDIFGLHRPSLLGSACESEADRLNRVATCSGAQSKCGGRAIKGRFGRRLAETGGTLWRTLFETERTLCETDARS